MALYSQNQHKADSLKQVLNTGNLSEEEAMEVLLKVTVNEPEPTEAIRYARLLLKNAEASNSALMQAKAYEEIGANERILGNNIRSTEASLTALNIFSELGLEDSKATILAQLGNNAVTDEDYTQAISYFKQALVTYEASQQGIYMALTRLNMGEAFRLNGQLDSAMSYFKSALSINDSIQHPIIASYTLGNLGMTYNTLGQLEDARSALSTAIKQVRGLGDPYTLSVYRADLALVDQKEQKWQAAEIGFKEALGIAQENALKEQIRDISEMMVTYYKLQADFENALVYQELFQVYQDSLVNKENVQELERVKANYEISQRDVEIELLNDRDQRRRQQTFAAIAAMVVFLGLSLLLYRSNRSKQQANQVLAIQKEEIHNRDEEKALLLKELNHRVKNNLQMISSLLNLQGNELRGHPAEAAIAAGKFRVDALALIHQKLYREDIHTTIALKDYLEELILNLCFSFDDRIKSDLAIEALDVNIDQAIPLALIVNEWVTNALKYAYKGIKEPKLVVRLGQNPGQLKLQVIDNGIGMSEMPPENHSSFGLKLVYSLAKQLKAEINYVNDQGSEWTLTIPTA